MKLETNRLALRAFRESDAKSLYELASNPNIGPSAGWPVHSSIENSRDIIINVLQRDHIYAITLKDSDIVIGSVGLKIGSTSDLGIGDNEAEIGYWIGEPYWGNGLYTRSSI